MRRIVRLIWREASPFVKRRLAAVLVLVVFAGALTAVTPLALKFMVDDLAGLGGVGQAFPLLPISLYVLSLWLVRTATEIRELVFGQARQRIFRTLSERVFSHLMDLPLRFHLDRQTGAVSQTLDNGLEGLRIIFQQLVFTYVPVVVELLTVLAVLARVAKAPLFCLFCAALISYLTAFGYSAAKITRAARRASAARIDATAAMTDGLLNYEAVKYFTAEVLVQDRVAEALRRSECEWLGFYRRYALNGLVVAVIFVAFLAGTVMYASADVERGGMTVGDFVLVNTYMLQVVRPLEMMGYAMQGLSHGLGMLEKLVQLLDEPIESVSGASDNRICGAGSLEFQKVCLSYGVNRPVLNNVSFRVGAGCTLGIVGPSGSGKSTIVRLLMRLLEPDSGLILIDGSAISGLVLRQLRSAVAVVPQDTVLFDDTLGYNIAFGRAGASREEVEIAARAAQLHDFVMALPQGYETKVGERGVKLSGGERQRVSIARAVLKSPKIYVFDEATSSLDSQTEKEILRSLRRLSRSNTTLVIAHRLSTVVHADEILVLENGHVAEQGTHESLLRHNGRYAALWWAQRDSAREGREMIGV
jgi:ABC-type transport system involved in Fe-S cluster assembly fused permease/ATPase subunit